MIKLRLKRIKRRPNALPQTGTDQSIYRVLCIAMLPDETKKRGESMYTASRVVSLGFDPVYLKELYTEHGDALYNWARGKEIHLFSDHKDERGNPKRPAMWTRKNWQDRVADLLWNRAADILDEACDMQAADGGHEYEYWYSISRGVYRVAPEKTQAHLNEVRALHATLKSAKQRGHELTEEQAAARISSLDAGSETHPSKNIYKPWLLAATLFMATLLVLPFKFRAWKDNSPRLQITRVADTHFRLYSVPNELRLPLATLNFSSRNAKQKPKLLAYSNPSLLTPAYLPLKDH